ncbi:MAG: inorganic phosphate transporter [Chloroflexi bacterium]|nr:inorganic phosphate transporter [Chloroflexota bacterium]
MLTATAIVLVALFFDFVNGFHDSANVVATMIASRAMSARGALIIAAVAEFVGPLLFGVAVATTIGKEIVSPQAITIDVVFAALVGAIIWNLVTWWFGIPSSSSHALIGGILGAVLVARGPAVIHLDGLIKVVLILFTSPIIGFVTGFLMLKTILFLARGASPGINRWFKRGQIVTATALALSHGANDAQKTMGIITMSLVTLGLLPDFQVPLWVILICAAAIGLGTALGGQRIIRTLGVGIFRIRPVHGFATQASAAAVIIGAALVGGPVSTTHVVSSAVMGVGASERMSKVRWGVAGSILISWFVTIPVAAGTAAMLYLMISPIFHLLGID